MKTLAELKACVFLGLGIALVCGQIASGQEADGDGDRVRDAVDNCVAWSNPDQGDTDGNGRGDACECGDQDGNGRVDVADLVAINRAIFDPALVSPLCDASGDGRCDVADIVAANLRIFGGPAYCPRYPSCSDFGTPVVGSCDAGNQSCADAFAPGLCFETRVDADSSLRFAASDGCSLEPSDLPGFPLDGDVNNPTQEVMSALGVSCPSAAFGTFRKPGARCGGEVPLEVCGAANDGRPCFGKSCDAGPGLGEPCSDDADCEDGSCGQVFCGDSSRPLACEQHDSCGNGGSTCGYRQKQCDNQFRRNLFRTCYALRGGEALCRDACLAFAAAYAAEIDSAGPDDGTWSQSDLEHQRDHCTCCPGVDAETGLPAVCGDSVCRRDLGETCATCPECCGLRDGEVCQIDAECESGACMPDGRCGRLPTGAPCETDAICDSGECFLGTCCATGSLCDLACLSNDDCPSGICNFGLCTSTCQGTNVPCTTDAACCSGVCAGVCLAVCPDGTCSAPNEMCGSGVADPVCEPDCGKCPSGTPCLTNATCNSGICNFGFCIGACQGVGVPCTTDAACCSDDCAGGLCNPSCGDGRCSAPLEVCGSGSSGLTCQSDCGRCPNGTPCTANATCNSGICNFGFCIGSCQGTGVPCTTAAACCSGHCNGICTPF